MGFDMKEYLVKNQHDEYVLLNDVSCIPEKFVIEIPKGSVKATLCNDYLIFWKDDFLSLSVRNGDTDFTFEEDEDYGFVEYMDINDDAILIWKRSESPNDKLASAEQYRQAEVLPFIDDEPDFKKLADLLVETTKHKPAAREWDLSDYDFAESDAWIESKVEQGSIEQTLAQRQSQYGCFEDVAFVTQGMIELMRKCNYDKMPASHQMALSMIASKMARIVNGDFNHKDSWHDIGGYAKLIENLIEVEDEKTK